MIFKYYEIKAVSNLIDNLEVTAYIVPIFCLDALFSEDFEGIDREHEILIKEFIEKKVIERGLSSNPFGLSRSELRTSNDICKHTMSQHCCEVHYVRYRE